MLIRFCAIQAIGGGVAPDPVAPHACMILVHRQNLDGTNTAALGGGSIISNRHVVTAAHLVQGVNINYQIGFIVNGARRLVTSTFRLIHEDYDNTDFSNDIALLFLQGTTTFPLANAIPITAVAEAPTAAMVTVGFGFTDATSTGASSNPYAAAQSIDQTCDTDSFNVTDTHFCAIDGDSLTWICPGDNGAGAFILAADAESENELVIIILQFKFVWIQFEFEFIH